MKTQRPGGAGRLKNQRKSFGRAGASLELRDVRKGSGGQALPRCLPSGWAPLDTLTCWLLSVHLPAPPWVLRVDRSLLSGSSLLPAEPRTVPGTQ